MIELRILEILTEKQLTKYWLTKHSGISYQNIVKMVNNETTSIHFENIEKLCRALNCTPNDIFKITPTKAKKSGKKEKAKTKREIKEEFGSKEKAESKKEAKLTEEAELTKEITLTEEPTPTEETEPKN